jgi:predicted transcriptional regulator
MTKRPDGTLEQDILDVLWAAEGPLQPGDVRDRLPVPLAYTSVATVLGRLHAKGLVQRHESGRAFTYEAAFDESQLAVKRIAELYSSASDKRQVLAGFLGSLPKKDIAAVRALLGEAAD